MLKKFTMEITCNKCGSSDIHICRHLDFSGWDDCTDYTNDIVLVCQNKACRNKELIVLKYEILL